ncbi:uncharacterized protein AB675_5267 [Cyphellophora attinorum]|uniref:RED-like N-terminal domain-containing protein n=1 Tax=Cyphellophora attinorum TaxID=1664694 RepID=A0A0N1HA46_9EURO|nr:uncharacterized protein AB675_5267 [Phialophora attinorum]KPI39333.1 hypothetical protein AB675_5267 [Phialophora attinorum]
MNNSDFRSLATSSGESAKRDGTQATAKSALGSRSRGALGMAPRSLAGRSGQNLFAKASSERKKDSDGGPPAKRFKAIATPRGVKLAQGYSDRATSRNDAGEEDGKVKKLKELEQMVKDEKIDQATFDRLREAMGIGGDLFTTHLVKGLDFKLLERARQGEDLNTSQKGADSAQDQGGDLDEALDNVLEKDVVAPTRDKKTSDAAGTDTAQTQALSRDEILRRLKESRSSAQKPAPEPALGDRFKKVQPTDKPSKKKFIEAINGRRREVLLVTQADGSTKRKSRWLDPEPAAQKEQQPLGMEVPAELVARQKAREAEAAAEDEDDDIFQGIGAEYDPLAGINSDAEDEPAERPADEQKESSKPVSRNYFGSAEADEFKDQEKSKQRDATLMAAFQKAAAMRQDDSRKPEQSDIDQSDKSKQFLARLKEQERKDQQDLDLGFGGTRDYGDDDDDAPIYDEGDDDGKAAKATRKRGGKKRKGDKDNVADVMSVLEGRIKK